MGVPQNYFHPSRNGYVFQRGDPATLTDDSRTPRLQNHDLDHQRPLPIHDALRTCCRIPVKDFVIIYSDEHGREKVCTSAPLASFSGSLVTENFRRTFRRIVQTVHDKDNGFRAAPYGTSGMYSEFEFDPSRESRKSSTASVTEQSRQQQQQRKSRSDESDGEGSRGSRKRPRIPRALRRTSNEEAPIPTRRAQQVRVDDELELKKLYEIRFKDMQQSSCKIMGKAFVKLVEPKKQTHHPYTKGDDKAPPWWPNTSGENPVRHREPDHLLKAERTRLLVHILGMIVEPNDKRCPSVQKLGLTVKKLEEATYEVMNPWLNDKEHPENAQKKGYLKEIFKVAKEQERYKNGEIDGTTMIPIMYGDKRGSDASEDEGDEDSYAEEDEHHQQLPTPDSIVSPSLMQGSQSQQQQQQQQHEMDHLGQSILPSLAVRTIGHTLPQVQELSAFGDTSYYPHHRLDMNYPSSQSPNAASHDRRDYSSQDYHNASTSMQGWQQQSMLPSSTHPNDNQYATSPQTARPPVSSTYLPPPAAQSSLHPPQLLQQYQYGDVAMNISARGFDPSPSLGHQSRTGSLPTYLPQQNFAAYLQDPHGYAQQEQDMKIEHQHQHQQQQHMS